MFFQVFSLCNCIYNSFIILSVSLGIMILQLGMMSQVFCDWHLKQWNIHLLCLRSALSKRNAMQASHMHVSLFLVAIFIKTNEKWVISIYNMLYLSQCMQYIILAHDISLFNLFLSLTKSSNYGEYILQLSSDYPYFSCSIVICVWWLQHHHPPRICDS
jgi:hypothetical protein